MNLQSYLQKPRSERMSHLNLETPCVPSPVKGGAKKLRARKKLLELLGIEIKEQFGYKACLCHRCPTSSTKGYCENPLHFYLGTFGENNSERIADNPCEKERISSQARRLQPVAIQAAMSEDARRKRKETMRANGHSQGEKNSQHGTMWITNGEINKKIRKTEPIPEGYYKGRKLK